MKRETGIKKNLLEEEEEEDLDIILGRNKQRRDFCGTFFF
jgi:hypothetical protein